MRIREVHKRTAKKFFVNFWGLNADFDGDIMNILGVPTKELIKVFSKFDPITRMIISRDTGLLNEYFTITKGQLIDLYYFCTM